MSNPEQKTAAGKDAVRVELAPPSFTMRVGKRRLTMSWRARKPVPVLLTGLLRRSWRAMFGRGLRISMTAAAICAAWNVPALAAATPPPVNTLPTTTVNGNTVVGGIITNGTASITQNGNTLNINQSSNLAIGNFTSFSIGANATVDISQPNSAAAFLARVTGTDPSLIYGHLKANGMVALINQNGIMVGPGGVVDVARFIASTLNITDSDFLAGKLTFNAGTTVGNVDNQGTIKTGTGGSVYLIGANVSNSGVIQSPNGEILLAAGQTVQLVDTATPGVTVNVTGNAGSVTNLGTITAEAGRIGIAAGLINNSGNINASSVVSEGGRIFLRASQNLTTTATSNITADGATKGGSVVLYSDQVAYIDGNVSATGAPGQGGFVETSGKTSLDVVKAPTIGAGGTWLIDPYDLEVVSDAVANASFTTSGTGPFAVFSNGDGAKIRASAISNWLSQDLSVTLATNTTGGSGLGNITINSAITKSAGSYAVLTLDADGNIFVNANITSTSGALGLNMVSDFRGVNIGSGGLLLNQINGATVSLNGGVLNVSDGYSGLQMGNLSLTNGAVLNLSYNTSDPNATRAGAVATGNLTVDATSSIIGSGGPNSNLTVSGAYTNNGALTLVDTATMNIGTFTNAGNATLTNVTAFTTGGVSNSGRMTLTDTQFNVSDSLTNTGTFNLANSTVWTQNGFFNQVAGIVAASYNTTFGVGQVFNNGTMTLDSTANKPNGYTGLTAISLNGGLTNNGTLTVLGTVGVSGGDTNNDGNLTLTGGNLTVSALNNNAAGNISGNGTINASSQFTNNGVLSPGGIGAVGALAINGNFTQGVTGVLNIDVASNTNYDVLTINAPSTVQLGGTLQSKLLGSYVPTLNTRFTPISFADNNAGSYYFSHVLGDVVNTGSGLQMIKVDYKGALALAMTGSEDLTFSGGEGGWNNLTSWSTGNLPTAIDNVFINGGVISHYTGGSTDIVNNLTITNNAQLNLTGGGLQVSNLTASAGNISIGTPEGPGGSLNITGTAQIGSLSLMYDGYSLNGATGSTINVNGSFLQDYRGAINSNGTVALTQTDGDLTVGNITAANLVLVSTTGSIAQNDVLHVTRQLLASSVTGITLENTGNRIAAFAANNRGINDISLINNLEPADTSVFRINGVTNANGSISIINTGATATTTLGSNADFLTSLPVEPDAQVPTLTERLTTLGIVTNGSVSAGMLSHTVTIEAHSPLTIGSGGITAAGGIALAAGTAGSGLSNDSLVVNGQLASAGGTINLVAGGSLNINANITGAYTPGVPAPVYGPGVTLNGVLVGPAIQTAAASTSTSVTPPVDTTSQIDRSVNNTQNTTTSTTPSTSGNNPVIDNTMTTGGGAGSFGGEDTEPTGGQNTPAGNDKKVVKLYCS